MSDLTLRFGGCMTMQLLADIAFWFAIGFFAIDAIVIVTVIINARRP